MFYERTLKLFKDFGFIMHNYDDVLAVSGLGSCDIHRSTKVECCAVAVRRDYLLLLSKEGEFPSKDSGLNWSGLYLLENSSKESIFGLLSPKRISLSMHDDAVDPELEWEERRWSFEVNSKSVGDDDSFTRFNTYVLAFLFKRRQQEMRATVDLLECLPEKEWTDFDSAYVCALAERLLNWFKVLP